jgi:protein-S-isoprenylcysteine O-methyltransferase Ste14
MMDIRQCLFKYRSYTPIPLILAVLILARPTWVSFFAGLALVITGESLRFWGVLYAGSATRTTSTAGACRLVSDGPYGHTRNPLYAGNFILSSGLVVMCWAWMPWMMLVFIFLFWLQYGRIVELEEAFLAERFGKRYAQYRENVPQWLFRFKSYSSPEHSDPKFINALKSERNTLQAIAAVVALILVRWHFL